MSYDLMVFEKTKAPQKKDAFIDWYNKETEWSENHSYDDPAVTSADLAAWYKEMIQAFPPLNGPDSPSDDWLDENEDSESYLTDYAIGKNVIYAAFSWSLAEEAYKLVKSLSQKYGVGFFDLSGDSGTVFFPDGNIMK